MDERSDPGRSVGPRSIIGKWLTAAMLRQYELREQLSGRLAPVKPDSFGDEFAVAQAARALALHRYFPLGYEASDLAAFAALLVDESGEELARVPIPVVALLRAALGEDAADVDGVTPLTRSGSDAQQQS